MRPGFRHSHQCLPDQTLGSGGLGVAGFLGGHVFTNWPIYGLAVLGPLGFMLNQRAFQHSTRVSQVLSIVTTVNPVVAVALGVGLLDEKIKHSPLAITGEALSLVLAIVGIVVIARHSPQAKQKAEAGNVREGY